MQEAGKRCIMEGGSKFLNLRLIGLHASSGPRGDRTGRLGRWKSHVD